MFSFGFFWQVFVSFFLERGHLGMRPIDRVDAREVLRQQYVLNFGRNQIALSVGISARTVSNILTRARRAGLTTWSDIDALDNATLRARLYPPAEQKGRHVVPDWDVLIAEYRKLPGRSQYGGV